MLKYEKTLLLIMTLLVVLLAEAGRVPDAYNGWVLYPSADGVAHCVSIRTEQDKLGAYCFYPNRKEEVHDFSAFVKKTASIATLKGGSRAVLNQDVDVNYKAGMGVRVREVFENGMALIQRERDLRDRFHNLLVSGDVEASMLVVVDASLLNP